MELESVNNFLATSEATTTTSIKNKLMDNGKSKRAPPHASNQNNINNNNNVSNITTSYASSDQLTNDLTISSQLAMSMSADEKKATKKSLVILFVIFCTSLSAMCYVYMIFPKLSESEKQHIKIPRDIQDAKMLANVLDRYKDMYYFEVMFAVTVSYIFLQTFAIPGSLFLSILLGFLYKFPIALFLICFCSSLGATLCYCLSSLVGRRLIRHFWPKKTNEWSQYVEKHRDSLFHYMLFLRMTPILPNWFINLASPVIGVPLLTFAFGTFFGVAPPSVLAIQTGKTLQKMTSSSEAFSWTSMGILVLCACLSLLPGIFKNKLKKKLE